MREHINDIIIAIGGVMELTDTTNIGPDTRLETDLGFDSGLYIELIMNLEDRIPGLIIDPTALRREDFLTVDTMATFIASVLHQGGSHL